MAFLLSAALRPKRIICKPISCSLRLSARTTSRPGLLTSLASAEMVSSPSVRTTMLRKPANFFGNASPSFPSINLTIMSANGVVVASFGGAILRTAAMMSFFCTAVSFQRIGSTIQSNRTLPASFPWNEPMLSMVSSGSWASTSSMALIASSIFRGPLATTGSFMLSVRSTISATPPWRSSFGRQWRSELCPPAGRRPIECPAYR